MSKTLLNAVNEVLKRVGLIAGDALLLQSLTDSGRQRAIDVAVQVIGEGVDELFTVTGIEKPQGQAQSTVVLTLNTRAYSLASDLVRLRFPLIDKTNFQYVFDFPGGYEALLVYDPTQSFTGLPFYATIRSTDGLLYVDRAPTAQDVGRVYTYQYDKDLTLDEAADPVPFNDVVFRAMVPAWAQLWRRDFRGTKDFDRDSYTMSLARAGRLLTKREPRTSYSPRRGSGIGPR